MSTRPVAVVTGASAGIGESLCLELARRGWAVGLLARRQAELERVAAKIREAGGVAAWATADVADRAQVEAAVSRVVAELGPCDLLVANAGVSSFARATHAPVEDWVRTFRINGEGPLYAVGAVLPSMLERRRGHLVVVASLAGTRGLPRVQAYSASKAAMINFWEGLRVELAPHGIACTTINPGYIATDMTAKNRFPMPFLMSAERAAVLMADAIAARRSRYAFPWQMAWILRFASLLPDWLWDRVVGDRRVREQLA